jgi:putative NADH-flavin reductase
MPDCDAVVSALGPPLPPRNWPRPTTLLGDGARATVEAMRGAGVRRLLVISGDVMFPDGGPMMALMRATLLRHLVRDDIELERVTQSSELDWTIARPTRLTNGALTGVYRAEEGRLPRGAKGISRADVAHFLLGAAERGEHVRQIVGLAR